MQPWQQTAKEGIQSESLRHRVTSLTPTDEMDDVMRDVRTRDSNRGDSVDVTNQTGVQQQQQQQQHNLAVREIFLSRVGMRNHVERAILSVSK